jgi:hypothetical protein
VSQFDCGECPAETRKTAGLRGGSDENPNAPPVRIGFIQALRSYSNIRLSRLKAATAANAIRIAKIISLIMMPRR